MTFITEFQVGLVYLVEPWTPNEIFGFWGCFAARELLNQMGNCEYP